MTRLIRVFPRRTSCTPCDDMAFIGPPPLSLPYADEVHVSATFIWDKAPAEYLEAAWSQYYPVVKLGGPAFDSPADDFVPGLYVRRGVTFTSRGCPRRCPFCLVPRREGTLRLLDPIPEGHMIQDNNFLACPKAHREKVYAMLRRQRRAAVFTGGLDGRLVTDEIAEELGTIRIRSVFLACDSPAQIKPLIEAANLLAYLGRNKLRCYVMVGFRGETIGKAQERLQAVWDAGCLPFCQLYQPPERRLVYPQEWRNMQRLWSRPAATKRIALHDR